MTKHDRSRWLRVLAYIETMQDNDGWTPSFREIAKAVGLTSTNSVHHWLGILETEGLIVRPAGSARTIRITPKGYATLAVSA